MLNFDDTLLEEIVIHKVGSKSQDDAITISENPLNVDENIKSLLKKYFTRFFKDLPFYRFSHESDLALNESYSFIRDIFNDPTSLYINSVKLARHLYQVSDHPNIKSGEFYVAYFDYVLVGEESGPAIGLFKSENKDTYLKVYEENRQFNVENEQGININKLDKGCLILNLEEEEGYKMMIIDNTNRNSEAQYWMDKFLRVEAIADNFYHTHHYLSMCRDFAMEAFPEAAKADQLALANESEKFFREQSNFDKVSYHEKVLQDPEVIERFENYKDDYQQEKMIEIVDEFEVAPSAVKKLKKVFKSVIKLDKNFHIYVHGNRDFIKRGYDEGLDLNYYQVFFKEES